MPRRPAVSLPTFKVTGFLAGSFTGGDAGAVASVGSALLALAPAEDASHEAHDLLLDQAQHFRGVVNVPELDLLGPGREPLLQQRQVFGLLQSDDPIRRVRGRRP